MAAIHCFFAESVTRNVKAGDAEEDLGYEAATTPFGKYSWRPGHRVERNKPTSVTRA